MTDTTPDPRQRIDPLGAAIFGAVAMVYWARCLPSPTCGKGAEALTLRVLGVIYTAEGAQWANRVGRN